VFNLNDSHRYVSTKMTSGQKETSAVNPVSSPKPDKIVSQIELEFRSARRGEL